MIQIIIAKVLSYEGRKFPDAYLKPQMFADLQELVAHSIQQGEEIDRLRAVNAKLIENLERFGQDAEKTVARPGSHDEQVLLGRRAG